MRTGPMGGGPGAKSLHDWAMYWLSLEPGGGKVQRNFGLVVSVMSSAVY
jgi:hypothetical protein